MSKRTIVIMGPDSDLDTMRSYIQRLKPFGISIKVHIILAHRTPTVAERPVPQARENGFGVTIVAVSKAAHLAGVLVAYIILPVIGVSIKTSMTGELDTLLSMVQIPKGILAVCVVVDGAGNAIILSAQTLALSDEALSDRLVRFKAGMVAEAEARGHKIQMKEF